MTVRVSQGSAKFAVAATGRVEVAQVDAKFAIQTGDAAETRVAQMVAKYAVRLYPVRSRLPTVPPVDVTTSRAPYIRFRKG